MNPDQITAINARHIAAWKGASHGGSDPAESPEPMNPTPATPPPTAHRWKITFEVTQNEKEIPHSLTIKSRTALTAQEARLIARDACSHPIARFLCAVTW
jgi:hypothetical protein